MNTKIAVLLALYNGAQYIEKQLDSLLEQTKSIDQLIIGDDGSTDGSVELVQRYIIEHKLSNKWIVYKNEKNLGHACNFISMCKMSDADFVFFCDQDDIWMPDKIASMVELMRNDAQIQFLYGDVINTAQPEKKYDLAINPEYDKSIRRISFSPENYFFKGLGCATCVRGEFLKKMLSYWTEGWEHDMFFWACAIMTDSGYYYNYPVIWRRIHDNNASFTGKKTLEKRRKQVMLSLKRPEMLHSMFSECNIVDSEKLHFINKYDNVLKRRNEALNKRNPLIAGINLVNGDKYYLHKKKGVILDIVLIIFGKYPLK